MLYSGYLYGGFYTQKSVNTSFEQFGLNIGITGPSSLGEDIQKRIHHTFGEPKPKGWSSQKKDEIAYNWHWHKKHKTPSFMIFNKYKNEIIYDYGLTLGNVYRNIKLGVVSRSDAYLPSDFRPGRINDPQDSTTNKPNQLLKHYLFSRCDLWGVEQNLFLQDLDIEPIVIQGEIGIVMYSGRYEMAFTQSIKSKEYVNQSHTDTFAGFNLSYRF